MYAIALMELAGSALLWWPRFELAGAVVLGGVLLGALTTLARHRESAAHAALPAVTLAATMAIAFLA